MILYKDIQTIVCFHTVARQCNRICSERVHFCSTYELLFLFPVSAADGDEHLGRCVPWVQAVSSEKYQKIIYFLRWWSHHKSLFLILEICLLPWSAVENDNSISVCIKHVIYYSSVHVSCVTVILPMCLTYLFEYLWYVNVNGISCFAELTIYK